MASSRAILDGPAVHASRRAGEPRNLVSKLLDLRRRIPAGAAVTIDFDRTPDVGQPIVLHVPPLPAAPDELDQLSARERAVATLVARGLRNKAIAERLFISVSTVKDNVHRILEKTGLDRRAAIMSTFIGRI